MKKFRVNSTFESICGLWTPGDLTSVITGTLKARDGRVELTTAPTLRTYGHEEMREWMQSLGVAPAERIEVFQGRTSDCQCTLFWLQLMGTPGVTDFRSSERLSAKRYRAGGALMGLHVDSADDQTIESASFQFSKIHEWLPRPWSFEMREDKMTYSSPLAALQVFKFHSETLEADVACQVSAGGSIKIFKGFDVKSAPRITITPIRPQSVSWFRALAFRLENFFSMFLGTSVAIRSIKLDKASEHGWFVERIRRQYEKTSLQLWIKCPAETIVCALGKWLAVPDERLGVERTLLGMVRKSSLYSETEFLGLAQALEGFGRLHFSQPPLDPKNFKRGFANLIGSTLDLLSEGLVEKLVGERTEFVRQIVQTRNYFTHLGIQKGGSVVEDGKAIFLLNQKLHALLRCVMLIDLGVPEEYLREPILYQSKRWH